ncbi:unnamed protein product [Gemmata massiliana]|uniref:Uncharacterized protein n=1 Tax=Gemmata massiliana TaxID=1210884 RepID=A0A6P2CZW8_9BACT|nr:hypothetical protein [Gemmata massiliana]VTR94107.1 unnamed protein product [Gemmata massiliana]
MGLSIADFAALAQRMTVLDTLSAAIAPAVVAELRFSTGDPSGLGRQREVALVFDSEAQARAYLEAAQAAAKKS